MVKIRWTKEEDEKLIDLIIGRIGAGGHPNEAISVFAHESDGRRTEAATTFRWRYLLKRDPRLSDHSKELTKSTVPTQEEDKNASIDGQPDLVRSLIALCEPYLLKSDKYVELLKENQALKEKITKLEALKKQLEGLLAASC